MQANLKQIVAGCCYVGGVSSCRDGRFQMSRCLAGWWPCQKLELLGSLGEICRRMKPHKADGVSRGTRLTKT